MSKTIGKWTLANQKSERWFSLVQKKWYVQSESRTVVFHVWEKWYLQSEVTEVYEFPAKIPAFYKRLTIQRPRFASASQSFNYKSFSRRVLLVKGEKHLRNRSGIVSCISLSMKIIVEGRRKNSRMGNRTRRKRRTLSSTEQLSHECALRYELAIIISYTTMAKANQSSRIAFSMIQFLIIICTQIGRFRLNTFIFNCAFRTKT